jgi:F-type H+-transporting ATPase subunit b
MWSKSIVVGMVLCVLPASIAAAEGGQGRISLFAGDFGNAFWTLLIFLLLLGVLTKWVWPQILNGLQHRERFIRESLTSAKTEREEAQKLLDKHAEMIKEAQRRATAIVDEGRRDAEEVKKRVVAESKAEGDKAIARAKREIELARDDAVKQLHDQAVMLATNIAGKIVERELTPSDHKRLVDEALAELGKMN